MSKELEHHRLTKDEREIFYTVYRKLVSAKSTVLRDKYVGRDALMLLGEAKETAQLEMPKDIEEYIEKLCDIAAKAYPTYRKLERQDNYLLVADSSANKERIGDEKHQKLISQIEKLEDPLKLFSKYLKIKIN